MSIVGHQKIIKFLDRSLKKNMISQAYIFSGSKHLGKFTLALDFAKKLAGESEREINPDIVIIRPVTEEKKGIVKKKDIKIEEVRELQKSLSRTAYFGRRKVVIIDDAERLTIGAQNALLKTLEEPNENCVIILIVHNQEKILPTIKSRCMIKKFNPVTAEEMREKLPFGSRQEKIIFWSLGHPGLAFILSENPEKIDVAEKNKKILDRMFQYNLADKFSLAEEWSKDIPVLLEELGNWIIILRSHLLAGRNFWQIKPEKILDLLECIAESLRLIRETNSNPRIVLENLFLKF